MKACADSRGCDFYSTGDVVRVRADPEVINELVQRRGIDLAPSRHWADRDLEAKNLRLVEAVIAPESDLVNRPLSEADLYENFGAVALAIRSRGKLSHEALQDLRLSAGDSLLLLVQRERVRQLGASRLFVLATAVETEELRYDRAGLSVGILALVVALPVLTPLPIVATALAGCVLAVLSGILSTREAYRSINWKVKSHLESGDRGSPCPYDNFGGGHARGFATHAAHRDHLRGEPELFDTRWLPNEHDDLRPRSVSLHGLLVS